MTGENPANDVFVDLDVERQGDLLCDSRTTCSWRIVISPATGSSPESVSGLGCDSPGRLGLEVKSPGPHAPGTFFLYAGMEALGNSGPNPSRVFEIQNHLLTLDRV
jgi:hypothetical protein